MRISPFVLAALWSSSFLFTSDVFGDWHLQWSHELPQREAAWQHVQRMSGDSGYQVAAAGGVAFVGCEHNGALLALDAATGKERWRFYTAAPIRTAPVASAKSVYVGSSDGHLYALDHEGKLQWKLRGGPSNRLVIGHGRVISAWPITTTPLLHGNTLFFTAGYWPVDGIYVHAVDATSGEIIWTNNAAEFRPNRSLFVHDGKLMVDGDNSNAVFDAATGSLLNEKRVKPAPPTRPEISGVKGNVTSWSQAGDTLVVGTTEGVFGLGQSAVDAPRRHAIERDSATGEKNSLATAVLQTSGVSEGYCLVAGLVDGASVEGILKQSEMTVIAFDPDAAKVNRIRNALDSRGVFDESRLGVFVGQPDQLQLPPYFASLVYSESNDQLTKASETSLRPYGGALVLHTEANGRQQVVRREGALPKAEDWTHEFHDASNTLASADALVKAPLGLLWYGGEAGDARFYFDGKVDHQSGHGLNPQPVPAQIIEGRMILQGPGLLGAIDIYTGRVLWETPLPSMYTFGGGGGGLGVHSKKHPHPWKQAEAMDFDVTPTERCRASGFNMVSQPDAIYVAAGKSILRIDPATGKLISTWAIPLKGDLRWGNLRVVGDQLVATLFHPQDIADAQAGHDGNGGDWAGDRMPMKYLVALDRQTGKMNWSREAKWGFLNRSGVCAGNGMVFCVDLLTAKIQAKWEEAGRTFSDTPPTLYALDLKTGTAKWHFPLDVYVQNIAYSQEHDLLLAPCRNLKEWRDGKWYDLSIDIRRGKTNKNAAGKMRALSGANGNVVWKVSDTAYHSPHIVMGDMIIDRWGHSFNLLTGQRHLRMSPLTGVDEKWSFRKGGCNHLVACTNMVTWRCAYYDLANFSGTKTLTGMDAGCSPTLLPAGGVLNIANLGTHHKRNRMTALALVHRPENDLWTNYATSREKMEQADEPDWITRAGFNFGASGDRFDSDDTLWLQVTQRNRGQVSYQPKEVKWFNLGDSLAESMVGSSGIEGVAEISIPLTGSGEVPKNASEVYNVKLHFAKLATGSDCLFNVMIEGQAALTKFNPAKESSSNNGVVTREFAGVTTDGRLDIHFEAIEGIPMISGVEIIRVEDSKP